MRPNVKSALERRGRVRYRVSAPATFRWRNAAENGEGEGDGVTRDMSANSLFMWSRHAPPNQSDIECQVFLPGEGPMSQPLTVECTGTITRVEPPGEHGEGFVVASSHVWILAKNGTVAAHLETATNPQPAGGRRFRS